MTPVLRTLALLVAFASLDPAVARAAPGGEPVLPSVGLDRGLWIDRVDLDVPPAPGGAAPALALVGTGAKTDSVVGVGWSLGAGGVITRHSQGGGVPGFTVGDDYRVDGQPLVTVASHYQPRTADGTRYDYDASTNTWTARRDGWTWIYGSKTGTGVNATQALFGRYGRAVRSTSPVVGFTTPAGVACLNGNERCNTVAWHLALATDPHGNKVTYNYVLPSLPAAVGATYWQESTRLPLLDTIVYAGGNAQIAFTYTDATSAGDRPDATLDVSSGTPVFLAHRLTAITVTAKAGAFYSRYELEYTDEAGTRCDGTEVSADPLPRHSLLRRIWRTGTAGAAPRRAIRCLEVDAATPSWDTDAAAKNLTSIIAAPGAGSFRVGADTSVPIAANLNGDGVNDLLVLGIRQSGHQYVLDHRAYVAAPTTTAGFYGASAANDDGRHAAAWQDLLRTELSPTFFEAERAWSIVDLDRDLIPELVLETAAGGVAVASYQPRTQTFRYSSLSITACDLRWGSFGDIDGDGRADLIRRAHRARGSCTAADATTWLRNTGEAPWFSTTTTRPLRVPLEQTTLPAAYQAALAACPYGATGPDDAGDGTAYTASQARLVDVNGDGLLDLAYALYACWEESAGDWNAIAGSNFSRLYYGDGYGGFIDSGHSAGPAFTVDTDLGTGTTHSGRTRGGYFVPTDVDGDGTAELLHADVRYEVGVVGAFARGLVAGFGLAAPSATSGTPSDRRGDFTLSGLSYVGGAAACHPEATAPVIADFTGDGFADVLTLEYHETNAPSPCVDGAFCALLRRNTRTNAYGRIAAMTNAWGGRTQLTWGSSAQSIDANPDLPVAVPVVRRVDGADGAVSYRYGGATFAADSVSSFSVVERTNARGGVDTFGYAITPALAGQLVYAARQRVDGTLERLTVFGWGQAATATTWQVDLTPPFTNPGLRQCDVTVGLGDAPLLGFPYQSQTISSLIGACLGWGRSTGSGFLAQWKAATGFDLRPAAGTAAATVSERAWLRQPLPTEQTALVLDDVTSTGAAYWSALPGRSFAATTIVPRWSHPSELTGFVPALPRFGVYYNYPVDPSPTTIVTELVDWTWSGRQMLERRDHGDVATPSDDLFTTYQYEQPDTAGPWYRRTAAITVDNAGARRFSEQRSSFAGFDQARRIEQCGTDGVTCVADQYTFTSTGDVATHTRADGSVESWTRAWCGAVATSIDPLGRPRIVTRDNACRATTETYLGVSRAWTYDAHGRELTASTTPNGSGAVTTGVTTTYDDALIYPEDSGFREPRLARRRNDGHLELEYLDGFGRTTRREECDAESVAGAGGLPLRCRAGTRRITAQTMFGTDGAALVTAEAFTPGEPVRTHAVLRDGYGRAIVAVEPSPTTTGAAWQITRTYLRPDRLETVDAVGRTARIRYAALSETRAIDGVTRGQTFVDALGNVTKEIDRDGTTIETAYDPLYRVRERQRVGSYLCVTDLAALGMCAWKETYEHDTLGRRTAVIDARGVRRELGYDAGDRVTSIVVDGVTIERNRYTEGTTTALARVDRTDELGVTEQRWSDGLGRLRSRSKLGVTASTTFGVNGKPATLVDGDGLTTTIAYDRYDRPVTVASPRAGASTLAWDGADRPVTRTDADGVTARYTYAYGGQLATATRGPWTVDVRGYDAVGRLISRTDDGVRSTRAYDAFDRLTTLREGLDASDVATRTHAWSYDDGDRPLQHDLTPRGEPTLTERATYHPLGDVATLTDAAGGIEVRRYDALGRVRRVVDAEGATREIAYDARGRVVRTEQPGRGVLTRAFTVPATRGAVGNLAREELVDGLGATQRRWRDALGRLVAIDHADGSAETYDYVGTQRRAEHLWSAAGVEVRQRRYEFAPTTGRLARVLGPDVPAALGAASYDVMRTYTAAGRLATIAAPDETTAFAYDTAGLLREERWGDQVRTLERTHVSAPWVTGETTAGMAGAVRRHALTRDALGRVTADAISDGSLEQQHLWTSFDAFDRPRLERSLLSNVEQVRHTWSTDAVGRPLSRATSVQGGAAATTRWTWFRNGVLAAVEAPSGQRVAYDYGTPFDHTLRRVYDPATGAPFAEFGNWNARGQAQTMIEPSRNRTTTFGHDARGRTITRSAGPTGAPPTSTWSAHYDAAGLLVDETFGEPSGPWTNAYVYDGAGRLIEERRGRTGTRYRYTLDRAGNRTSTSVDRGAGWATTLTASYAGARTAAVNGTALAYDAWDGVTRDHRGQTYGRLPSGRERAITGPRGVTSFVRGPDGIAVAVDEAGGRRRTTWGLDPGAMPLEITSASGAVTTYVQAGGAVLGTLSGGSYQPIALGASPSTAWFASAMVDDASAFGDDAVAWPGVDERFVYAGLERVPAADDVLLARLRVYDPELGRFLSPDPSGLAGGLHRARYADGDPVNRRDPMGLSACTAQPVDLNLQGLEPISAPELMDSGYPNYAANAWAEDRAGEQAERLASLETAIASIYGAPSHVVGGPLPCQIRGCAPTGDDGSLGVEPTPPDDSTDAGDTEPPAQEIEFDELLVTGDLDFGVNDDTGTEADDDDDDTGIEHIGDDESDDTGEDEPDDTGGDDDEPRATSEHQQRRATNALDDGSLRSRLFFRYSFENGVHIEGGSAEDTNGDQRMRLMSGQLHVGSWKDWKSDEDRTGVQLGLGAVNIASPNEDHGAYLDVASGEIAAWSNGDGTWYVGTHSEGVDVGVNYAPEDSGVRGSFGTTVMAGDVSFTWTEDSATTNFSSAVVDVHGAAGYQSPQTSWDTTVEFGLGIGDGGGGTRYSSDADGDGYSELGGAVSVFFFSLGGKTEVIDSGTTTVASWLQSYLDPSAYWQYAY